MKPILIWITGLAGSGKTTIGREVYKKIKKNHSNTIFLDGDGFREIIGQKNTGHSLGKRFEIGMQIARTCRFLVNQGINVVCATISLFKEIHKFNRKNIDNYFEVFIDCDIEELIRRDKKQIYSRAVKKKIKNVVGIDIPYDRPKKCDLIINNTKKNKLREKVRRILSLAFNKND